MNITSDHHSLGIRCARARALRHCTFKHFKAASHAREPKVDARASYTSSPVTEKFQRARRRKISCVCTLRPKIVACRFCHSDREPDFRRVGDCDSFCRVDPGFFSLALRRDAYRIDNQSRGSWQPALHGEWMGETHALSEF